jgi:hypothetical protein
MIDRPFYFSHAGCIGCTSDIENRCWKAAPTNKMADPQRQSEVLKPLLSKSILQSNAGQFIRSFKAFCFGEKTSTAAIKGIWFHKYRHSKSKYFISMKPSIMCRDLHIKYDPKLFKRFW